MDKNFGSFHMFACALAFCGVFLLSGCEKKQPSVENEQTKNNMAAPTTSTEPNAGNSVSLTTETAATSRVAETEEAESASKADYAYKTSEVTAFDGPFKVTQMSFESTGFVTVIKATIECTTDFDHDCSIFFHPVKDKTIVYGFEDRKLEKSDNEPLKAGDRINVKVVTQLAKAFKPEDVTGIRFGIVDRTDAARRLVISSGLEIDPDKTSVVWTF